MRGAITTDFILPAEIMVIALTEVAAEPTASRVIILVIVALASTALVYGAVALIIKMDDIGLKLAEQLTNTFFSAILGLVWGGPHRGRRARPAVRPQEPRPLTGCQRFRPSADPAGPELDADPRADRARRLGDAVLPGALAGAAHHDQVAGAERVLP